MSFSIMEEVFKNIEGYEGLYQISNLGRVKSLKFGKEKILKPGKNTCGYLYVVLCNEGKCKNWLVHRLVASVFIENPYNLPFINHKDENPLNNNVNNLEWCTPKYNSNYGTINERISKSMINRKDISKPVRCLESGVVFPSTMDAQRQTGIYQTNISSCCRGKQKTAGGYHWQYI